jgi:hypothetical protein
MRNKNLRRFPLDKILAFLGLCRIAKAKGVSLCMHLHYVRQVQHGVEKDFGVKPNQEAIVTTTSAWLRNFDQALKESGNSNGVNITNAPKFSDC